MNDLTIYKIPIEYSVKETITHMENHNLKFVFIMEGRKFRGLFTNGDMRKFFLKGGELNSSIKEAMNFSPIVYSDREKAAASQSLNKMIVCPIVHNGELVDAIFDGQEDSSCSASNALVNTPLVIMAGGKGTRLYPYTKILPKALIPIGEQPISELIIESFQKYGCKQVYFILNYKANMIKAYYNDLEKKYNIGFIEENEYLGTGGGLSLLKGKIDDTFIVSNCDIFLNADFECALQTHKKSGNIITIICAMKDVEISYGVITTNENGIVQTIKEKPEMSFLTNTGVYIIEPEVIDKLNVNEFIHLPDIAKKYMENGNKVGVFPIPDNAWLDMGQMSEMEKMIKKFQGE